METTVLSSELQRLAELHNLALEHILSNFNKDGSTIGPEESLDIFKNFIEDFLLHQMTGISPSTIAVVRESLEEGKVFAMTPRFIRRTLLRRFDDNRASDQRSDDLVSVIRHALNEGYIGQTTYDMYARLHGIAHDHFHDQISAATCEAALRQLKADYDEQPSSSAGAAWKALGAAIYMAKASFDWWAAHPADGVLPPLNPTVAGHRAAPPVWAVDAAGGIMMGGYRVIRQKGLADAAESAVVGGIVSSTAVVQPAAAFIAAAWGSLWS